MNMQLTQCFSRAKPFWLQKPRFRLAFFYFQKKAKVLKKARISRSGFKKQSQIGYPGSHHYYLYNQSNSVAILLLW